MTTSIILKKLKKKLEKIKKKCDKFRNWIDSELEKKYVSINSIRFPLRSNSFKLFKLCKSSLYNTFILLLLIYKNLKKLKKKFVNKSFKFNSSQIVIR